MLIQKGYRAKGHYQGESENLITSLLLADS